jgi:phosphohistidine phosphatase
MRLYVMRHGPAEDRAATGRDFDRALTRAGRDVVLQVGRALRSARDGSPTALRVMSSPLRRARETAEIVAVELAFPAESVELHDDLAADAGTPLRLVGELASSGADALLVGHQPTVEELVRRLLHPLPVPLPNGFRTATIVALERVGLGPDAAWRSSWVADGR